MQKIDLPDNVKQILAALKDAGYDRFVSIEMRNQGAPDKVLSIVDYVKSLLNE